MVCSGFLISLILGTNTITLDGMQEVKCNCLRLCVCVCVCVCVWCACVCGGGGQDRYVDKYIRTYVHT